MRPVPSVGLTAVDEEPAHVHRDEFYALAETFDGMLEELEEVFRREQQFTSDASHELRTPVSVILAQCDAMLSDESLTEEQRSQLALIRRKSGGHVGDDQPAPLPVQGDQGRQPIHRERLDLSELTEMIVEEQQMLADGAPRHPDRKPDQPGVEADADETLYIRMVSNLLSNAVRYSHDGGKVEVILEERDGEVRGRVKDYGVGIAADDLPRVWGTVLPGGQLPDGDQPFRAGAFHGAVDRACPRRRCVGGQRSREGQ